MALDMFMVINTPDIKGESKDKEFGPKGGIDVLAWSWGCPSRAPSTRAVAAAPAR